MPQGTEAEYLVVVDDDVKLGTFANAFRVLGAPDGGCFLDFLVYSAFEGQATVRVRVRVERGFLNLIYEALTQVLGLTAPLTEIGIQFQN